LANVSLIDLNVYCPGPGISGTELTIPKRFSFERKDTLTFLYLFG